jgi:CheY-like chemotaxis protein
MARNRRLDTAEPAAAVEIVTELADVPAVNGLDSELREVLMNVIFNAMDAMPQGGTVTVRTTHAKGKVMLSVSDTGVGISAEARSKLFTPFFSTKGDRGSGLGLSIALNIITQHGGSIDVDSGADSGTTVRIKLPQAQDLPQPKPASSPPSGALSARVLLVEDEPLLLAELRRLLEGEKHRVAVASTGAEALRLLESSSFDVVLTDVGMEPVSGWQIAEQAKAGGAEVIFMTGWGAEVSEQMAAERGVRAVLRKPFPAEHFFRAMATVLSRRRGDTGRPSEHQDS